jgi:Zn finger protein HypA/HybF involved in hydrogenase expression
VSFFVTGDPAAGEFRCSECGYGVTVSRVLPRCPMCGGEGWETYSPNKLLISRQTATTNAPEMTSSTVITR